MQMYELLISPECEEHIAAHHVKAAEVEEVVFGRPYVSRARNKRYRLIGQLEAGRYLTVFLYPDQRSPIRSGDCTRRHPIRASFISTEKTALASSLENLTEDATTRKSAPYPNIQND